MPLRGDPAAPRFSGDPYELSGYFDDVHFLASEASISDAAAITYAIRHADIEEANVWKTLDEVKGHTWDEFVAAVIPLYPGAADDGRYRRWNLEELVRNASQKVMRTREDLGRYHREFLVVSDNLRKFQRISEGEQGSAYMSGLYHVLRSSVLHRLSILYPDHYPDEPYP